MNEIKMTEFEQEVYRVTKAIPFGKVATYLDIAKAIGKPGASRAVGNALHKNPLMIIIPCHRVVNRQGGLAVNFGYQGYQGHQELLESEGVKVVNHQVDLSIYRADLSKCSIKSIS